MVNKKSALLAFLWLLTLGGAFCLGLQTHSIRDRGTSMAQVECLKLMWGNPLTTEHLQKVRQFKEDPEALRAYFLGVLKTEGWWDESGFITSSQKLPKIGEEIKFSRMDRSKPRAAQLLSSWVPGQTDIRATLRPTYLKDKSPLWELYLINPEEAWARGVDDIGAGGR